MTVLEIILCCVFIGLTAWLLLKKVNPPTLLLSMGLVMIAVAAALGITPVGVEKGTGSAFFDLFRGVEEKFQQSIVRLGFMIMTIGGYVALMNRIKATDAMVYLATRPLAFLKGKPYLAAVAVIPIGMLLYLPIPSASGLGLLLASTLYPILVGLGVSRLTALSVISAATMFDMGPGSANGLRASELIGMDLVEYFVGHQLFLVGLTTVVVMVAYYFTSRYYDKKDLAAGKQVYEVQAQSAKRPDVPLWFAVFPVLPLVLLVVFSKYLGLFDTQINAAVAMLVCVAVVFVFLLLYQRNVRKSCDTLRFFIGGDTDRGSGSLCRRPECPRFHQASGGRNDRAWARRRCRNGSDGGNAVPVGRADGKRQCSFLLVRPARSRHRGNVRRIPVGDDPSDPALRGNGPVRFADCRGQCGHRRNDGCLAGRTGPAEPDSDARRSPGPAFFPFYL